MIQTILQWIYHLKGPIIAISILLAAIILAGEIHYLGYAILKLTSQGSVYAERIGQACQEVLT